MVLRKPGAEKRHEWMDAVHKTNNLYQDTDAALVSILDKLKFFDMDEVQQLAELVKERSEA